MFKPKKQNELIEQLKSKIYGLECLVKANEKANEEERDFLLTALLEAKTARDVIASELERVTEERNALKHKEDSDWDAMEAELRSVSAERDCLRAEVYEAEDVNAKLQAKLEQAEAERNAAVLEAKNERNNYDALKACTAAESEELAKTRELLRLMTADRDGWRTAAEERRDLYNIAMQILDEAGVDMDKFIGMVARIKVDMEAAQ